MRRRLILGAAYLLLVVVAGLAVPFGLTLSRRLTSDLGGRVERQAFAVAAAVEDRLEHGDAASLQSLVAPFAKRIGGRVLLTDRSGVLLADSLQAPGPDAPSYRSRPEIARALAGAPNWEVRTSRSLGYDLLVSAVPVGSAGRILGAVRISFPMAELRAAVRRSWWFLGAVGAVALAAGLALAAWLAGWATSALATAASVARRIAGGDLRARVPEAGPPEVRGLATDMNAMADRVVDMVRGEREFAANASHQLRTPLSALRLSLEEALAGTDPRREVEHALVQADRLNAVVGSLLALGRARERGATAVDLAGVAEELVASLPPNGVRVEVSGSGVVLADPDRVRQVVGNLLENAGRFARARVLVEVTRDRDGVAVLVDDDGPGIPEADRARVFDRFYRGRLPGGPGSGLGLPLARELAAADGGTVVALESPLGGARFEVVYPAVPGPVTRDGTTP